MSTLNSTLSSSPHAFRELTLKLQDPLQKIKENLTALGQGGQPLQLALDHTLKARMILNQLLTVKNITLFEQEYVNFCDLIIYGSEITEYIIRRPAKKDIGKKAAYWQFLAKQFSPFLQLQNDKN